MSWILFYIFGIFLAALHQTHCSGVFELRLLSFDNEAGKDDLGKCCSGILTKNSECDGMCRPRFRVCLKEYQVKIDTTSPCTFGDVITNELGPNPNSDHPQNGFDNPISFPFPFTWPGTFSLIVEAWHGNQSHTAVLVSRLTRQRWLDVSDQWTEDVHNSKYSTLKFQYRVTCQSYYYGKGCENLCRPRDDNFGHYSCSPTGERVCLAGWTGDYCTKPRCLPGCDEQHGHCTQPNECRCQPGWEGPLCNQCQRYPGCMHGTCVKPWDCHCIEGWGGLFCNQDLNFCTNHKPCRNGGTCFNTGQGSYTCSCPPGYTGNNCELPLHDCTKHPCLNGGHCQIRNGTLNTCSCPYNYSGLRCEIYSKTCHDNPCQNSGTCIDSNEDGINTYKCECKSGFSGTDCEYQMSSCHPNPCKNDGTCVESTNNGFQCICPLGFSGNLCETNIDDCLGQPCKNGGTCIDKVNEFYCQCVPGFVGPLCQNRVDYCITKPCANGGTCLQLINDYKCKCASGFTGKDCSEEIDECQFEPCQHGGTCVNRLHGYECHCAFGYSGKTCEFVTSSAAPSARISSESNLTTEHVVVIATISTFVPLVVLVAVAVIICLKQRRKREKARADEEARLQNEQNTANSSFAKRSAASISADTHMIKNSWGKCTNNVLTSVSPSIDDCGQVGGGVGGSALGGGIGCTGNGVLLSDCDGFPKQIDGRPVYSLQRTRSQKQLNTEPTGTRASILLANKLHEPDYEPIKRLSVMSNASAVCGTSDPSLLKRPTVEKESGVYVIQEHFHREGLFATEV